MERRRRTASLCAVAGFLLGASLAAAQDPAGAAAKAGQAHVVVYRVNRHRDPTLVKPAIYCDEKEVALMYSDRFFTINLTPGKHTITSDDGSTSVSLDAQPGVTYYVVVVVVNGAWTRNRFSVAQVDTNTALTDLTRLKPADASHIKAPNMVSIGAIPGK